MRGLIARLDLNSEASLTPLEFTDAFRDDFQALRRRGIEIDEKRKAQEEIRTLRLAAAFNNRPDIFDELRQNTDLPLAEIER